MQAPKQYFFADTGSTNGCFVNGVRLPKNGEVTLKYGDVIRLAGLTQDQDPQKSVECVAPAEYLTLPAHAPSAALLPNSHLVG